MSAVSLRHFSDQAPRVLLVDDEYSIRLTFSAFLEREGCRVMTAEGADEALELLAEHEFDLVLLDIQLKGLGGMELLARIRDLSPRTPVLLISGQPSLETATEAVRLGAFDYLFKPIEREELLRATGRALAHKALLDEKLLLEQGLAESERKLRLLADHAGDVIWIMEPDGRYSYINPVVERLLGYTPEEAMALDSDFVMNQQDAATNQAWRDWLALLAEGRWSGQDKTFRIRLEAKDGQQFWFESVITPLFRDGVWSGVMGISRNVTQRVQAEASLAAATEERERYRRNLDATFASIPDAIIAVDAGLRVISLNAAAKRLCGLDAREGEVFGSSTPCPEAHCLQALQRTIQERRPLRSLVVQCRCSVKGTPLHVELNCAPLASQDPDQAGAVLVVKDVTRLLSLEKQLGERQRFHNIIGKSKKIQEIFTLIEQLAPVESTVLIQGETGTGKELVADALHYGGPRSKGPLVKVNCSALSENLLESELFGHVRGAFTGAVRDKEGRIQAASGGTLLLDEVADLSPYIQLKLLRFLEQKEYERVGESQTYKADVRVIAASNLDLLDQVTKGRFREDLFYRLNVMVISLPPLRERSEDIPLLVAHFLEQFGQSFGKRFSGCSTAALAALLGYPWPGNIRELKHSLEHACILCPGGTVDVAHLPRELLSHKRRALLAAPQAPPPGVDKQHIMEALAKSEGNKAKAARLLGIDRSTLYRKLARYALD